MPFGIHPAKAVFENRDFETGLQQVFGGVADAILGGNSNHINYFCAKQLKHFRKALPGGIAPFETGVLLRM